MASSSNTITSTGILTMDLTIDPLGYQTTTNGIYYKNEMGIRVRGGGYIEPN